MRRLKYWMLAAILTVGFATDVNAAPAEPSRRVKRQVRRLIRQGQRALRAKRYTRALRRFQHAHRLWPRKELLFNQALTYLLMKRKIPAAIQLRRYLKEAGPTARAELPKMFKRLLSEVCVLRLSIAGRRGTLWVNGRRVGRTAEMVLLPGSHLVELKRTGQVAHSQRITLRAGQQRSWKPRVMVYPPPPPPPPEMSSGWQRLHWAYFAVAAGVTAVAAGALIGVGLKTNELEKEFAAQQTVSLYNRGRAYKTATNALIGVTAAAAVGAAVLAVFTRWKSPPKRERPRVSASVTVGGATLLMRW